MTSLLNIAGNIPVVEAGGQSLRFEDGDSPSFSFEFGTPTNQIKWTMSFWCKRGEIGREHAIYGAANGGGETFFVAFYPDDIEAYISNGRNHVTNAVFRDPSAWYHIVQVFDSANSTANDRFITYVNGVRQTTSTNSVALNDTTAWNTSGVTGYFGKNYGAWFGDSRDHFDGYLANVCFIDGQALDPTSFGEYDDTLWKPKSDADIQSLTFGTNGFYLPFKQTTEAEGFSTVTYTGNGGTQSIEGVGFEPDLVWIKRRDAANNHGIFDSVRGATKRLSSNRTNAEDTVSGVTSFDSNGFTLSTDYNESGASEVAWCWDAGTGSPVSNTDGSITSSVKSNTAKGFSIVSYTGTGANATVGHGLSSAPEMIILKNRTSALGWPVYHSANGATKFMQLEITNAVQTASTVWQDTAPTSSVFSVGTSTYVNQSSSNFIAYCFHSVSGYSSIGSYTGTGASGNSITGLGFKPAWVMTKRTDSTNNWVIRDNTRDPVNPRENRLFPNSSSADSTGNDIDFDSDGFTLQTTSGDNVSGGTYIYMAFADTRDATFFGDTSGNGNNWTPNKLNNTDVVPDSPVSGGNFCTMSPIDKNSNLVLSEGNLKALYSGTADLYGGFSTQHMTSGKWYAEFRVNGLGGTSYPNIGITKSDKTPSNHVVDIRVNVKSGGTSNEGTAGTSIDTFADGDILGIAFDADNGNLYFSKNGTFGQSQDPAAGTGAIFTGLTHSAGYKWGIASYSSRHAIANFGQDSSFAGNKTPQGNTDDNGVGDFYYAPPSGFLCLKTSSLPTPTITAPDEYFNTVLYTGDGLNHPITGVGFQPDWVWIKERNGAVSHRIFDAIRGAGNVLKTDSTDAEASFIQQLKSFDSDGFTVGTATTTNNSGDTYVAWNWLANGTGVSNTSGSITSTVSANTTAGFSIQTWTGDASGNATVGHGLSQAPEMIIIKPRTEARHWLIWHKAFNDYDKAMLFDTGLPADNRFGPNAPTSTVYGLYSGQGNRDGTDFVGYAFHSVEGYSKIGSYTGNGSTDGTFVHCGFRPAFVMVKNASAVDNWHIVDNTRSTYNLVDDYLSPNASSAESTFPFFDFTSNGFKNRSTGGHNTSGQTIIFMAFAEAPFKSANAR